jgi:streptomycin 6-kinase
VIEIPDDFVRATVEREGARGREWVDGLPGLVDELLERWGCTPDAPVRHGQVGVVVPVRYEGGLPAALKVSFPHPGNVHEPDAFAAWGGRGAVVLHERDDARFAMLLERAGHESLVDVPDLDEVVALAGRLARRLAVPAPPGLPRLRDRAGEWEKELLENAALLGDPLPRRLVDAAAATYREFARDQPDTLIHGDLHPANVLRAEREPWLAIDPKGWAGDLAYDAFTMLRNRRTEHLLVAGDGAAALRLLAVFADAAGIDRARARRWAQARTVTSALWGRRYGDPAWLVQVTDHFAEVLLA